jgi:serine/threonine-protein kinase
MLSGISFRKVRNMYDIEKTWPKWKIVRVIGEGSFGKVYEICRNEFGVEEHSALKVISVPRSEGEVQALRNDGMTVADTDEYFKGIVNDFVQEIQLMSRLKGKFNVVGYEDFAVIEKTDSVGYEILIRMELLAGVPQYMRENSFRVIDVIRLGIDMCRALEVCREHNIVHRDIKPDNIFVSASGSYKLGDFGIARTIEKTTAGLSRKGTFSYMAPEIYNGKEYGFEADIYSLGIVLYKMLNNNRDPFLPAYPAPVRYSDKMDSMLKRMQGVPLPAPVNANEQLTQIVIKACAFAPEQRYSHPSQLREALEALVPVYRDVTVEVLSEPESAGESVKEASVRSGESVTLGESSARTDSDATVLIDEYSGEDATTVIDSTEPPQGRANFCPSCGNALKQGSNFCGKCGYKLEMKPKISLVCPGCGAMMKPGASFCGKCGTKL